MLNDRALDVTVVLPCHNEGPNISAETQRIHHALTRSRLTFEILCIDDGSTDNTPNQLHDASESLGGLRVLTHTAQLGAGAARRLGTTQSHGRVIVWTDCDLTYPNNQIPDLIQTLENHPAAEQVIGARTSEQGTHAATRRLVKTLIRHYLSRRVGQPIPDLNSGLRVFYRDSAEQTLPLLPNGFSCTTTMTLAFLLQGRSVTYHPITYRPRSGTSKFHPVTDTYRLLRQAHRILAHHAHPPIPAAGRTVHQLPANDKGSRGPGHRCSITAASPHPRSTRSLAPCPAFLNTFSHPLPFNRRQPPLSPQFPPIWPLSPLPNLRHACYEGS